MYDQFELDQIIAAMRASGTTALTIKASGKQLRLVLQPDHRSSAGQALATEARQPNEARSPGIGNFLPRGTDDGLPTLETGAEIKLGEVLGYVVQGAVRMIVSAPCSGTLTGEVPASGHLCGYGDTLFTIEATR
ncbi:MAG: hypothetical protein Q4G26_04530 [Paracoccus sp. (in: a-proteobacteria)]|nr:hypothetical protein [Paracoccus sp. (in: a-proteobacteria)]